MNWIAFLTVIAVVAGITSALAMLTSVDPWGEGKVPKWAPYVFVVSVILLAIAAGMGVK